MDSTANSPKVIKQFKKEINIEDKNEELRVQQALKDISLTTKSQQKAHKAALKADSNVAKLGKKETVAIAAVQKATREHDIATTHLQSAQHEADLKRKEDIRLQSELDEKKSRLDAQMEEQRAHKRGRGAKIHDLESNTGSNSTRAAEMTGPQVQRDIGQARAPGTTTVDDIGTASSAGQYGTGPQAPGTRGAGPGYADHSTGAMAAGAGLAGGAGLATAAHAAHHNDKADMSSRPNEGYNQANVRANDGNVGNSTEVGVGKLDRNNEGGPVGDSTLNTAGNSGYPREGPADYGAVPTRTGPSTHQVVRNEGIFAGYSGRDNIQGKSSYSGGGENLGFRGDRMMGGSGTSADPGIRTAGSARGGSGTHEYVAERDIGVGGRPDIGYNVDHIGGQQNIHRGTGIGGGRGVGEDPDFSRDRNYMGGGERFGPGLGPGSDIDGRVVPGPISTGMPAYGENTMPGGYAQGSSSGVAPGSKERY